MKNTRRSLTQRPNSSSPGQVMIEFALVILALVVLFLGTMDLARAIYAYGVISDAARTGAHWGSLRPMNPDGTLHRWIIEYNGDASIEKHVKDKTAGLEWNSITTGIVCDHPTDGSENPYQKGQTGPAKDDPDIPQAVKDAFWCASWNQVTVSVTYEFRPIAFPLTMFFSKWGLQAESTMTIE